MVLIEIVEDGLFIAHNGKYIPKLAELLGSTNRRGKSVPHHNALGVFDAELTPMEEYLDKKESETFRSALGICLYIAQERLGIQQAVRVLVSYMGRPTKTSWCALKKLGSYLVQTQRTRTHYPHAELFSTTLTRWNGVEELELYSDSDWASCKVTRRSTSSGLNFFNSCCIHGHSRDQASISVSSMEAEILAATGLLVEGIMLKQFLQFSKDLSTRLLWSQQAMRLKWFLVERMSAKENPADLNTKSVVAWRERREYLMRKMALLSDSFESEGAQMSNGKVKQMVRLITWMLVAGNLQGCDVTSSLTSPSWLNPIMWTMTTWWTLTSLALSSMVVYIMYKNSKMLKKLQKHKTSCKWADRALHVYERRDPLSGLWFHEEGEEKTQQFLKMIKMSTQMMTWKKNQFQQEHSCEMAFMAQVLPKKFQKSLVKLQMRLDMQKMNQLLQVRYLQEKVQQSF